MRTERVIKEMEYQLAAGFLGANIKYTGRPLDKAHVKHPIMGGHFARRRQILKETLEAYRVAGRNQGGVARITPILCARSLLPKRVRVAIRSLRGNGSRTGDNYG